MPRVAGTLGAERLKSVRSRKQLRPQPVGLVRVRARDRASVRVRAGVRVRVRVRARARVRAGVRVRFS